MGLAFAGLLALAADYFHVEEDPRIGEILAALPGANCGACGLAGCRDYSEKLVQGAIGLNCCTVGGAATGEKIAAILGMQAGSFDRKVAAVHCGAKRADRVNREADDEASHKFRSDTKCQRLALLFLSYGRCFNSSHSLSSVI